VVLHAVLDTTQPNAPDRTTLYVDGAPAALTGGTAPSPNATIDLATSTHASWATAS